MAIDLALLAAMVVMFACGITLLLERSVTRMIFGVLLVGNATNLLLFLTAGAPGLAPLQTDGAAPEDYSDPLPQAFILTAIVITLATTAFMLALLYRSWQLARVDVISDDEEDIALRTLDPEADDELVDLEHSPDTDFDDVSADGADAEGTDAHGADAEGTDADGAEPR